MFMEKVIMFVEKVIMFMEKVIMFIEKSHNVQEFYTNFHGMH